MEHDRISYRLHHASYHSYIMSCLGTMNIIAIIVGTKTIQSLFLLVVTCITIVDRSINIVECYEMQTIFSCRASNENVDNVRF